IVFLGTGGGRFAMITQRRRTAGIRIISEKANVHLDPGPGALVYSIKEGLDPQKLNGILVSHCHPDHYTDAEVLIEAMTRGMTRKRGVLAAPRSVLKGSETCQRVISTYHQSMPEQTLILEKGVEFQIQDLKIKSTEARHTEPDTVGFRFETTAFGDFAYTSDTEYFEGIGEYYRGVRLLLLCVMRPSGKPWKGHMTTDDAIKIVREAGPEQVIITHLGMQMIFQSPFKEAKKIQEKTSVPTLAAMDGMRVMLAEEIKIETPSKRGQSALNTFI
ncbi:MBL fold metallo-hydrolase, partial [Candidatus Bathyarchaeota archaeon]